MGKTATASLIVLRRGTQTVERATRGISATLGIRAFSLKEESFANAATIIARRSLWGVDFPLILAPIRSVRPRSVLSSLAPSCGATGAATLRYFAPAFSPVSITFGFGSASLTCGEKERNRTGRYLVADPAYQSAEGRFLALMSFQTPSRTFFRDVATGTERR